MLILSFHKATSSLFQGIIHKILEATLSLSKHRAVIAYSATSCVLHPIPTRPALLQIIHVCNLHRCLYVYNGSSTNRYREQSVKHPVENSRLHSIAAFWRTAHAHNSPETQRLRRRADHDRQPRQHLQQSLPILRPTCPPLREYDQAVPS